MAFKDYVQADIDKVFFNTDEFAEYHNINGRDIKIIIDDDLLKEQKLKVGEGVFKGEIIFRVRISEYGEKPAIGSHITYDLKKRRVFDCQTEAGEYIVTLEAYRS